MPDPSPASPCVKICVVDPVSGLCIGCGRTVGEIATWSEMSHAEQRRTIDALPGRLKQARSRSARGGRVRPRAQSSPWL